MSAGLFIAGIAVIWGAVLLSLVQLEHSLGASDLFLALYGNEGGTY